MYPGRHTCKFVEFLKGFSASYFQKPMEEACKKKKKKKVN